MDTWACCPERVKPAARPLRVCAVITRKRAYYEGDQSCKQKGALRHHGLNRVGGGQIKKRLPNAVVQLQARCHHCGEAASEECLSAATFVRPRLDRVKVAGPLRRSRRPLLL